MTPVQRELKDTLEYPAYLDPLAILENMEKRAFLDTPGAEGLQGLTDRPVFQDCRDPKDVQAPQAHRDTQDSRETRETPDPQDLALLLMVVMLFKDLQGTRVYVAFQDPGVTRDLKAFQDLPANQDLIVLVQVFKVLLGPKV